MLAVAVKLAVRELATTVAEAVIDDGAVLSIVRVLAAEMAVVDSLPAKSIAVAVIVYSPSGNPVITANPESGLLSLFMAVSP